MWESRTISIEIQLPHDIADQAEEVQKTDPEFLSRVVLYGLTRRSIYHQLRDVRGEMEADARAVIDGRWEGAPLQRVEMDGSAVVDSVEPLGPISGDEDLAELLEENEAG